MSTTDKPPILQQVEPVPVQGPVPVETPLGLKELTKLLVKHYGFTEGKYDPMVEYQIGAGPMGPTEETRTPSIMVSFVKLGLAKSTREGPFTVDATVVNPMPKKRRSR